MAPTRRMPGGVVPRRPSDDEPERRRARRPRGGALPPGAPFDPAERPLGMIAETWVPKEEPGIVSGATPDVDISAHEERIGPSLTVWIILITLIVVVILAVISYRNAPP